VTLLKYPAKSLSVPSVDFRLSDLREVGTSVAEAITETVEGGDVHDELLNVLDHSSCPHVQALREAIAKKWAKSYAYEVACCRVES
jgi:hypothetical protein